MSAWYVYTMRAATIRQSVGVCRVLYMYRRGLTALLILLEWAMRRPESWGKQETGTHAFRVWPDLNV